jgi:hypothetical protein
MNPTIFKYSADPATVPKQTGQTFRELPRLNASRPSTSVHDLLLTDPFPAASPRLGKEKWMELS